MKKIILLVLLAIPALFLSGCGAPGSAGTGIRGPEKIVVGTGTQFPNICFIDDKGNLTGYDVEVVRAIDKLLPDYSFEFKTMDFSNLLLSLGTKKIDMIAHNMAVNEERKEKFLFNEETYNYSPMYLTVNQKTKDISYLTDLKGKKVIVGATSNAAVFFSDYNKKHDNPFELLYAGQGSDDAATQLKTGRADATLATPFAVDFSNKANDAQQKIVGDVIINSKVYFMFNKNEYDLSKKVDEALKQLKKNGTLKKLSTKWLGADYTVKNE